MAQGGRLGERAIAVGGGMGGLFSARVLSDHFDEVIVLDRDSEPVGAGPRRFENPQCIGDFPNDDLPDLMLLGEAAAAAAPGSPEMMPVNDIATLRVPLSAIRALTPV